MRQGEPLLHRLHTALSVTVTAGEERVRKQEESQQDREKKKVKKGEGWKQRRRGGQRSGGYCSLPLLFPPLQKMATSIKSLMIPALCHGSVGKRERDRNVWAGESRGVTQSRGEIMEWVMEREGNWERQRKGEGEEEVAAKWVEKEWGDDKWRKRCGRVRDGAAGRLSERGCDMHFPYGAALPTWLLRRRLIRHVTPRRRSVTLMDTSGTKRAHERTYGHAFIHTSSQIRWGTYEHTCECSFFFCWQTLLHRHINTCIMVVYDEAAMSTEIALRDGAPPTEM